MRFTLRDNPTEGFVELRCQDINGGLIWQTLIPDDNPQAHFNQDFQVEDWRAGANGELLSYAPAAVREPEKILGKRIDDNLPRLRNGIASFDTDGTIARWATVKVMLIVVFSLAKLIRGRMENVE